MLGHWPQAPAVQVGSTVRKLIDFLVPDRAAFFSPIRPELADPTCPPRSGALSEIQGKFSFFFIKGNVAGEKNFNFEKVIVQADKRRGRHYLLEQAEERRRRRRRRVSRPAAGLPLRGMAYLRRNGTKMPSFCFSILFSLLDFCTQITRVLEEEDRQGGGRGLNSNQICQRIHEMYPNIG